MSIENLHENLKVLENLPLDFNDEIETCISSIRNITSNLLTWKQCSLNINNIFNLKLSELSSRVWKLFSRSFSTLPHPEIRQRLLGLILDKVELIHLSLRYILVDGYESEDLPLCREIMNSNPSLKLQSGESILLKEFYCSPHHGIDTKRKFEQVLPLLRGCDNDSSSWTGTLKLAGFRDWIQNKGSVPAGELTARELHQALRLQLAFKNDCFSKPEKLILYRKMLDNCSQEDEKMVLCLKQFFSGSTIDDQAECLLKVVR